MKDMDQTEYAYKNGFNAGIMRSLQRVESALDALNQPTNDFDWGRRTVTLEILEALRKETYDVKEIKNF